MQCGSRDPLKFIIENTLDSRIIKLKFSGYAPDYFYDAVPGLIKNVTILNSDISYNYTIRKTSDKTIFEIVFIFNGSVLSNP